MVRVLIVRAVIVRVLTISIEMISVLTTRRGGGMPHRSVLGR